MIRAAFRQTALVLTVVVALFSAVIQAEAVQRPASPATSARPPAEQGQPAVIEKRLIATDADADRTREGLADVLSKYPPSLARVLKLDPTLLTNEAYLAPYPLLAQFLAEHPEVAHNPAYFLERVTITSSYGPTDPRELERQQMNRLIGDFSAFMVFLVVTGVIIWLIRMIVESRRWNRLSKVQFDVHTKLLDRFASSEELMAYIQTPAGRKFLESAPIQVRDSGRSIGAPLGRILISLQAGVVLAIAGLGVLLVSLRFTDEPAQFFFVVGIVTMALGAGFIVSAGAAYGLSRKLGLLEERAAADNA